MSVGEKLFFSLQQQSGGRGTVSWSAFSAAIVGIGWPQETALRMWNDTDRDRSGFLDRQEFLQFCAIRDVAPHIQRVEASIPPPQAQPVQAQPVQGQPVQGLPVQGQPVQGPVQGQPVQGQPFQQPPPQAQPVQVPVGARLFDFIDGKGGQKNGRIEWTEFLPFVKFIGWQEDVATRMWYDNDSNRKGFLDRNDFIKFSNHPEVAPHVVKMEAQYCASAPQVAPAQGGVPQGIPVQGGPVQGGPVQGGGGGFYQNPGGSQDEFASNCQGRKRALFIGINYFGTKSELRGCINDVRNISAFVQQAYGFRDIRVLTDDQQDRSYHPTRQNIISSMQWLITGASPGDSFFLHYSGHGSTQSDSNGDEQSGSDQTICPVDYSSAGMIIDDEIKQLLVRPLPRGVRLTAIFDSCHSGSVMDLPFTYNIDGNLEIHEVDNRKEALKSAGKALVAYALGDDVSALNFAATGVGQLLQGNKPKKEVKPEDYSPADVIQFSGCRDDQTSADANISGFATGAASYAFIEAMKANPRPTYVELLRALRQILAGRFSQVPQMSTGRPMKMSAPFFM